MKWDVTWVWFSYFNATSGLHDISQIIARFDGCRLKGTKMGDEFDVSPCPDIKTSTFDFF